MLSWLNVREKEIVKEKGLKKNALLNLFTGKNYRKAK